MSPYSPSRRPTKKTAVFGFFGGVVHLLLVSALWLWFGFTTRFVGSGLFLFYIGVGAFALGAIPSSLLNAKRLTSPLLVVGGLLTISAYSNWTTYVAQSPTPVPVGPTAFGWYLLGWVVVLGVALLVGGLEYGFRRRQRRRRAESMSQ